MAVKMDKFGCNAANIFVLCFGAAECFSNQSDPAANCLLSQLVKPNAHPAMSCPFQSRLVGTLCRLIFGGDIYRQ